jgi:hypothetical protein
MGSQEPEEFAALGHEDGDCDGHEHPTLDEDAGVRLSVRARSGVRSRTRSGRRHLLSAARVARKQLSGVHQEGLQMQLFKK